MGILKRNLFPQIVVDLPHQGTSAACLRVMSISSHIDNALLIDLDGVIYQGDRPIAGAVDSLDWLKQRQIPHLYVTNTTSRSRAALLEKFIGLGFEAQIDELMTPIVAANQWLATQQMRRIAAFVSPGALVDFDGVEIIPPERDEAVDAVVIGDLGNTDNGAFGLVQRDLVLGVNAESKGVEGVLRRGVGANSVVSREAVRPISA